MAQNDITEHLGLPLPYAQNQLSYDVEVLRNALSLVDTIVHNLQQLVATKADSQALGQAMQDLQAAINQLGAARVRTINGLAGEEITLGRADLNLGPANGPSKTDLTYDAQSRISAVAETLDGKPVAYLIDYDASGRVQKITTTFNGKTRTETLAYSGARLTGTTATEGAA